MVAHIIVMFPFVRLRKTRSAAARRGHALSRGVFLPAESRQRHTNPRYIGCFGAFGEGTGALLLVAIGSFVQHKVL